MECTKTCMIVLASLILSTAGFVLTITAWFAPPLNEFVANVRVAGPVILIFGFVMMILSCVLCSFVQGRCFSCCYKFSSRKRVMLFPDTAFERDACAVQYTHLRNTNGGHHSHSLTGNGIPPQFYAQIDEVGGGAATTHAPKHNNNVNERTPQYYPFPSIYPTSGPTVSAPQIAAPNSHPSPDPPSSTNTLTPSSAYQLTKQASPSEVWIPLDKHTSPPSPNISEARKHSAKSQNSPQQQQQQHPVYVNLQNTPPQINSDPDKKGELLSKSAPVKAECSKAALDKGDVEKLAQNKIEVGKTVPKDTENNKSHVTGRTKASNNTAVIKKTDKKALYPPTYYDVMHKKGAYDVAV